MKLLSVFGIGILRIFQSLLNKQTSAYMDSVQSYLRFGLYFESVASLFAVGYLFIVGFGGFNVPTLICSAVTGALFLLELLTSLKSLKSAPLALCTLCSLGGGIILPVISGTIFFEEPMHLLQWLGVAVFFVSAYLLMPSEKKRLTVSKSALTVLACNFLINGLCGIVGKYFAVRVENGNAALFACLSYACAALCFGIVILVMNGRQKTSPVHKSAFPKQLWLYGGAVGVVCATIVYFSTVLSRTVSIVELNTIPNAVCLVGNLICGVLLFREKFKMSKLAGIVLSVISTVIIISF